MGKRILALGGDGIGPEVLEAGIQVLQLIDQIYNIDLEFELDDIGGISWDKHGTFCTNKTIEKAKASDAILVGAVGGPKWDNLNIKGPPENQDGLMKLRKELDAFLGIRPALSYRGLQNQVPLKKRLFENADILILREMTSGVMFSQPRGTKNIDGIRYAFDTAAYNEIEIRRFVREGFELARKRKKKICSIDKANVMESYKLWRKVVDEVSNDYRDIELTHYYADNCAFRFVMNPSNFDVMLGCNFLGDLFSDLAAIISGGLGLLPSACLCGSTNFPVKGIYEPVHGSAPDIMNLGKANPIGMILSISMMFYYSFNRKDISKIIDHSVKTIINKGHVTRDLNGHLSTQDVTKKILDQIKLCH